MNIGLFDSGLGGLTILKELLEKLPSYNYIYLGDNARVPYGGRSKEEVYKFTKQAVKFLFAKDCKLIILACNTATANALRKIQKEYLLKNYPERRVLGIIIPTVQAVVETGAKRVGVLATRATVNSQSYTKELRKLDPTIKVFQQAGPLLVPFIEEGETKTKAFDLILHEYLKPLIKNKIQLLILGCTHYALIKDKIQKIVGKKIKVVGQKTIIAEKLKDYLNRHREIEVLLNKDKKRHYYVTSNNRLYKKICQLFLRKVDINLQSALIGLS